MCSAASNVDQPIGRRRSYFELSDHLTPSCPGFALVTSIPSVVAVLYLGGDFDRGMGNHDVIKAWLHQGHIRCVSRAILGLHIESTTPGVICLAGSLFRGVP